jgi:hypothetical protein
VANKVYTSKVIDFVDIGFRKHKFSDTHKHFRLFNPLSDNRYWSRGAYFQVPLARYRGWSRYF